MVFQEALIQQDSRYEINSGNLGPPRQSRPKAALQLKEFPHIGKVFMAAFIPICLAFFLGGRPLMLHNPIWGEPCWHIALWNHYTYIYVYIYTYMGGLQAKYTPPEKEMETRLRAVCAGPGVW